MKILFFGDIAGKPGRRAIKQILPRLKKELKPDLVLANIENAAHGKGITKRIFNLLLEAGVDFFTSGNHIYSKPDAAEILEQQPQRIIRPANFSEDLPGSGFSLIQAGKVPVLVINLNGQVFMEEQFEESEIDNPFVKLDQIFSEAGERAQVSILDFHAEATSEKRGMGFHADGKVSAVLGTHTHVQTADAQVLPGGTGYITDVGMTGAAGSVIGAEKDGIVQRFLAHEEEAGGPIEVADTENYEVGYCIMEIDEQSGKCENIFSKLEYL